MTKFEKKANELGLDLNDLSKAIKKEVNDYYEGVNELKTLKDSLNDAEEGDVEAIQNEINELEEVLNDFDVLLVQKIEKFNQNKASYDDKIKKMAEGRERAKQAKLQGQANPTPLSTSNVEYSPTTIPTSDVSKLVEPQPQVQPQQQPKIEEETPKEEKSDWSWLIIAGIVGAVTLGAVMLRKK